ncbi:hypothetical protein VSAK1_26095 [Vibrio mediterranei AK1]|nr:hypothetical protein VSAK1_26095 [Vibrio mediterranei AK1]
MNEMALLSVGQPYPGHLPFNGEEGAIAEFMRPFGNRLVVVMPDISDYEEEVLRRGDLYCGLLEKNGAILLIWEFRAGKTKVITYDSPFDARLIPDLVMDDLNTLESRYAIDVQVFDSRTHIVKALRSITMPPALSRELMRAVKKQLKSGLDDQVQHSKWMQKEPHKLAKKTLMWKLGC